jgi:hypothetical protein
MKFLFDMSIGGQDRTEVPHFTNSKWESEWVDECVSNSVYERTNTATNNIQPDST